MAPRYALISTDDHVQEPPDPWSARPSQKQWGDRVPRLVRTAEGTERRVGDGPVPPGRPEPRAGPRPNRSPDNTAVIVQEVSKWKF